MPLVRVRGRMPIEPPVHSIRINVVKRVHVQFAPLDVESCIGRGTNPIGKLDVKLRRRDDIIIVRFFDQRLDIKPEVADTMQCREVYRSELTSPVPFAHAVS